MGRNRIAGAVLFLFIPLVLVLYLRMPLGTAPSVLAGVAIMLGHRLVARPFMERHLHERCFWCGRSLLGDGTPSPLRSRGETIDARACTAEHAASLTAFARAVAAAKWPLAVLIVAPVVVYLLHAMLVVTGHTIVGPDVARAAFKVPIALAVVSLSFLWPLGRRSSREPAIDFPAHNLSLLGVAWTLWIFRIVGLAWLAEAAWKASARG